MSQKVKKVTFLSRHYPPNPNINGESIWDMAKYLMENFDIEPIIITTDQQYEGGGQTREPIGTVIKYHVPFKGKDPLSRLANLWFEGRNLVKLSLKHPDSVVIATSSPPLLPMWANVILGKQKHIPWGVWFFDLFPEFFAVTGMISPKNPIYKTALRKTYKHKPNFIIALGHKQAEYLLNQYQAQIPYWVLPCGIFYDQPKSDQPPEWLDQSKITLCYCGRLGLAHNPEFVKAVIRHLDPDKFQLVLALYGEYAQEVKDFAKDKPGVILVDRVPRSQLHFIDVHLVSLRKEWTHIAIPSKAVSAVTMGSSYLFCGSEQSDTWYMLNKAGWLIDESQDIDTQVKQFLQQLTPEQIAQKKAQTPQITQQLLSYVKKTYDAIGNGEFLNH